MNIKTITSLGGAKHVAIMDNSSISFFAVAK